ncbi:MAG: T9SS type A sorting domain-containing protein, partial [Candidatus Delongbacteria bacterium]|nr:T9SS type A sorting domain-containing protein [Candidatus Delongbacteria bacterium]
MKKSVVVIIAFIMVFQMMAFDKFLKMEKKQIPKKFDKNSSDSKLPYGGTDGGVFDKSGNGAGWYQGYNRKVQWNMDPVTGPMLGSVYRRLSTATGAGTIGGMTGVWGASLSTYLETLYDYSPYWDQLPGGRYPYTTEFINGYLFGQWTDYDSYGTGDQFDAHPICAVGDATWGYDWVSWSDGVKVSATEGGATVPGAWSAVGDVVYDPATGYYYWTQTWSTGLELSTESQESIVVGRSLTPDDINSWVWTDYNDLHFDATDDTSGMIDIPEIHVAYCKDTYGNGSGYGIAVAIANDVDDNIEYNESTLLQNAKISYLYTTNWGGDDSSGDWSPNWIHDEGNKLFQIEMKDLFDWYGENLTSYDSVGVDSLGQIIWEPTEVISMNDPFLTSNISAIATENNVVHLLFKAFPATMDNPGYFYYYTDHGFRPGYYHVRGDITPTGVIWSKANYVASTVDNDTGDIEFMYTNFNNLSIGYAGYGQIYASWLDKPTSRAIVNPYATIGGSTQYIDDAFITFSYDEGKTWEIATVKEVESGDPIYPIWTLYYATNVTKTSSLHEEGWCVSNHGKVVEGQVELYTAHQYYDPANPIAVPQEDFTDFQQFLHVWKITGVRSDSTGVETEQVSLEKDFMLYQNYPNPFNPATEIKFALQNDANVKLAVFNTKGETVANLKNEKMVKGHHTVNFDASALNSGVYFYKLYVNGRAET